MILDFGKALLIDLDSPVLSPGARASLEAQAQAAVDAERERLLNDVRGLFVCDRCGAYFPDHKDYCVWYLAPEAP